MSSGKCKECQVGRTRPENMSWLQSLGAHMVVLPNAPATRCDMCGHVDFDPLFLVTMNYLLEQFSKDQPQETAKKQSLSEQRQGWAPARRSG